MKHRRPLPAVPAPALNLTLTLTLTQILIQTPALLLLLFIFLFMLMAAPAAAEESAAEWRFVFKGTSMFSRAGAGDFGRTNAGNDTHLADEESLRIQLRGTGPEWLEYQADYLLVRRDPDPLFQAALGNSGNIFRRFDWRDSIDLPEGTPSTPLNSQGAYLYHELDRAWVRIGAGSAEIEVGRQPITWGAGRIWQPTDLFVSFAPLAMDTEYKPGIDAVQLHYYPTDLSSMTLAYVLGPKELGWAGDSAIMRYRGPLGEESEMTLLAGAIREEDLAGGSLESAGLGMGWRIEGVAFRRPKAIGSEANVIAGADYQLDDGGQLLGELYYNSLGATYEDELRGVLLSTRYRQGRIKQLSRFVLGTGYSNDFAGLWNGSYLLFVSALKDNNGSRPLSLLHQLLLTYSISSDAEAAFSLLTGSGRGEKGTFSPRSEFGHMPATLVSSIKIVL